MAVYVCRRCEYEQATEWLETCPSCNGFYRPKKIGVDSTEQKQRSTFAAAAESNKVYIKTGIDGFDKTIGGGLVAGSPILLGGFRGAGKSTLLCMVADAVAKVKGRALYASSEEGVEGVMSIAHRLELRNENVEVLGNQQGVEKVIRHAKETKPFLTIFDSLQKFASDTSGGSPGSPSQERVVCEAILSYCRETKRCAIVVSQMSKGGEMKGSTDAAHAVDTVLILAYTKDDDEDAPRGEDGIRLLCVDGKNRNGSDSAKSYWRMTDAGVLECVPPRSKLVVEPRRKYAKEN
jgi:DNA repair protein RadA/Sms